MQSIMHPAFPCSLPIFLACICVGNLGAENLFYPFADIIIQELSAYQNCPGFLDIQIIVQYIFSQKIDPAWISPDAVCIIFPENLVLLSNANFPWHMLLPEKAKQAY